MTEQELAAVRKNHMVCGTVHRGAGGQYECCRRCWQRWPCDAVRLADEVERLRLGAGTCGAIAAAAVRDLQAAERERDAARADAQAVADGAVLFYTNRCARHGELAWAQLEVLINQPCVACLVDERDAARAEAARLRAALEGLVSEYEFLARTYEHRWTAQGDLEYAAALAALGLQAAGDQQEVNDGTATV